GRAIVVLDVRGGEILTGTGHAAAREDLVGTGVQGTEGAVVGAAVEVTRGTRRLAVTTDLYIPEERLAETDGSGLVDDVAADWLGNGKARERRQRQLNRLLELRATDRNARGA